MAKKKWLLSQGMLEAFENLGCRPALCHGCGKAFVVGGEIGINNHQKGGAFVHKECVDIEVLAIEIDPEVRKRLWDEIGSNASEYIEGKKETETVTHGPALTYDDFVALGFPLHE